MVHDLRVLVPPQHAQVHVARQVAEARQDGHRIERVTTPVFRYGKDPVSGERSQCVERPVRNPRQAVHVPPEGLVLLRLVHEAPIAQRVIPQGREIEFGQSGSHA